MCLCVCFFPFYFVIYLSWFDYRCRVLWLFLSPFLCMLVMFIEFDVRLKAPCFLYPCCCCWMRYAVTPCIVFYGVWLYSVFLLLRSHSNFMLCTPNQIIQKNSTYHTFIQTRVSISRSLQITHTNASSENNVEHSTSLHNTQHSSIEQKKKWRKEPVLKCVSAAFYGTYETFFSPLTERRTEGQKDRDKKKERERNREREIDRMKTKQHRTNVSSNCVSVSYSIACYIMISISHCTIQEFACLICTNIYGNAHKKCPFHFPTDIINNMNDQRNWINKNKAIAFHWKC